MFAIPGIVVLLAVIYLRPQEFIAPLRSLPLLYVALAMALFGLALDIRLRLRRPEFGPVSLTIALFFSWCLGGELWRSPSTLGAFALQMGTAIALWLTVAAGVSTLRSFQIIIVTLLVLALFVSAVAVDQARSEFGCHALDDSSQDGTGVYDGRPCETRRECYRGDPELGAEYVCEHVGLFGTSSIGGRVRYRGLLNDPNELALAVAITLPFAFALFERRRTATRFALVVTSLVLITSCIVETKSRGGQLVLLTVLGTYFVKRFRWKGLLVAALIALPILLLGGRSGDEADSSSEERIGCMYEGMSMVRAYPIIGVGQGQFTEHHVQTAHNSYVLAPAELGLFGLFLWSVIVYLAVKIPVQALATIGPAEESARTLAMALLASWCGLLVGIFFLSFCYHPVLWIFIGLSSALAAAMRRHDDTWRIRFTIADAARVIAIDAALVLLLYAYTRIKGAP